MHCIIKPSTWTYPRYPTRCTGIYSRQHLLYFNISSIVLLCIGLLFKPSSSSSMSRFCCEQFWSKVQLPPNDLALLSVDLRSPLIHRCQPGTDIAKHFLTVTSVTKFGEISLLWQNIKVFGNFSRVHLLFVMTFNPFW